MLQRSRQKMGHELLLVHQYHLETSEGETLCLSYFVRVKPKSCHLLRSLNDAGIRATDHVTFFAIFLQHELLFA